MNAKQDADTTKPNNTFMKSIFVLKMNQDNVFGYFDGGHNWTKYVSLAEKFSTYPEAEDKLKSLFDGGVGGFIQIEKYFINE